MRKILLVISLIIVFSCTSNNTPHSYIIIGNDKLIQVLTYGYPRVDYFQRNKIARKYKFTIKSVAGCLVTQKLIDSVTKVDEIAYQDLEKINGKDWQKRYEIDVAEEFRRDSAIIAKVELLDSIKAKDNELKKTNNGLHFYVDSALNNDTYRVNVTGYLVPTTDYVSYYRVYYNFSKLKVDSFDNKILFMFKGK